MPRHSPDTSVIQTNNQEQATFESLCQINEECCHYSCFNTKLCLFIHCLDQEYIYTHKQIFPWLDVIRFAFIKAIISIRDEWNYVYVSIYLREKKNICCMSLTINSKKENPIPVNSTLHLSTAIGRVARKPPSDYFPLPNTLFVVFGSPKGTSIMIKLMTRVTQFLTLRELWSRWDLSGSAV